MKIKTIKAVNAYKTIKDIKMTSLPEEVLIAVWNNLKALRPVSEEYDEDVKDARMSLEDDNHTVMMERLQKAVERERQVKEGKHIMTPEENLDVQEINRWVADFQSRGQKFFDDIANKEIDVEISLLPESEMLKVLKENGKTFEVMESLSWMIE